MRISSAEPVVRVGELPLAPTELRMWCDRRGDRRPPHFVGWS